MDVELSDADSISPTLGEPQPLKLPAHRYIQGERVTYGTALPLGGVMELIERPDPEKPLPGNRRVEPARARAFAEYLGLKNWVSPGLTVRILPEEVRFTRRWGADGLQWGELEIPKRIMTRILDGQHRTLGTYVRADELREKIERHKNAIIQNQRNGNADVVPELRRTLRKYEEELERLHREYVSIEIVEATQEQAEQMFVDIARNAKGVNPDFTAVLDQRQAVNRIAVRLSRDHPLLQNRVEEGQERAFRGQKNPNLLGIKGVADIVRTLYVGIGGRVGKQIAEKLDRNESDAEARAKTFFDVLVASNSDLREVMDSTISPSELREKSMIGSLTMLRVLAGAYYELTKTTDGDAMTRSQIEGYFRSLEPLLREIPVREDGVWVKTGAFQVGALAPGARPGDVRNLTDTLVGWARTWGSATESAEED